MSHADLTPPPDFSEKAPPPAFDAERGAAEKEERGHSPPRHVRRPGEDGVPENFRELDFLTRNGLNLRSFQKRLYPFRHTPDTHSRYSRLLLPILPVLIDVCLGDWGTGDVELDRSMKSRHLHMIAIGGSIGAGFFVGSGGALTRGGPGSLLICFLIAGVMIFNVVYALGELAVMYPVSGGFYTYSIRFIDPSWGFAMGWNYVGISSVINGNL